MNSIEVVNAYFDAMKVGRDAAGELLALFAEDAVYTEPFSGGPRTHHGREAIEACLRAGWESPPPDMTLTVDRIDVDGEIVRSEWTCSSPAFPGPMKGVDVCTVRDGRIAELRVTLRGAP